MHKLLFLLAIMLVVAGCSTQTPQAYNSPENSDEIQELDNANNQESNSGLAVINIYEDGVDPTHMRITQGTSVVVYNFIDNTDVVIVGPHTNDVLGYRESIKITLEAGKHTLLITPRDNAAGEFTATITVV